MVNYNELWVEIGKVPDFPGVCPCCQAGVREYGEFHWSAPVYGCGGQYRQKPQIQNHTDKFWGSCPVKAKEKLEATTLLDADAIIWAVRRNGDRWHIASFSHGWLAADFASAFSKDYPRFWDDESKIAYIEVLGNLSGIDGQRFCNGELIAEKSYPSHIDGAKHERVWIEIEQLEVGHYRKGKIIEE